MKAEVAIQLPATSTRNRSNSLFERDPELLSNGDRRHHVIGIVRTHKIRLDDRTVKPDTEERMFRIGRKDLSTLIIKTIRQKERI